MHKLHWLGLAASFVGLAGGNFFSYEIVDILQEANTHSVYRVQDQYHLSFILKRLVNSEKRLMATNIYRHSRELASTIDTEKKYSENEVLLLKIIFFLSEYFVQIRYCEELFFNGKPYLDILCDEIPGCDLYIFIFGESDGLSTLRDVQRIARDIFEKISVLHQLRIVHRDIKLENIMITHERRVRIIDFGCSVLLPDPNGFVTGSFGTKEYVPPELLENFHIPHSFRVDWYAFGVVLHLLLYRDFPEFFTHKTIPVYANSESLQNLISALTDPNPGRRLTGPEAIRKHAFFLEEFSA